MRPGLQCLRLMLVCVAGSFLASCDKSEDRPPREPVIKVEFRGVTYDFIFNEDKACGTLENGTPYVEAKWLRPPTFDEGPPFLIKGAGGFDGNTYQDYHTWIEGQFDGGNFSGGFAIYGEDRPVFDDDDRFYWDGRTPLGDEMSVEIICP